MTITASRNVRIGTRTYRRGDEVTGVPAGRVRELIKAGHVSGEAPADEHDSGKKSAGALRQDGPTIAEFVSAGYLASKYPPEGYASRSTQQEIDDAITVETEKAEADAKAAAERADLEKLTNKQLQELAAAEGTAVETDDNKATLVDKIVAGRAAKG